MTARQKRIAVAKDVLAQIAMKRIGGKEGSYLNVQSPKGCRHIGDVQSILREHPEAHCECCAIGATILCIARHEDSIVTDCSGCVNYDRPRVHAILGERLAERVEAAFEGWGNDDENAYGVSPSIVFYDVNHHDSTASLRTIYSQIAKTGTFFALRDEATKIEYVRQTREAKQEWKDDNLVFNSLVR